MIPTRFIKASIAQSILASLPFILQQRGYDGYYYGDEDDDDEYERRQTRHHHMVLIEMEQQRRIDEAKARNEKEQGEFKAFLRKRPAVLCLARGENWLQLQVGSTSHLALYRCAHSARKKA